MFELKQSAKGQIEQRRAERRTAHLLAVIQVSRNGRRPFLESASIADTWGDLRTARSSQAEEA